MDVVATLQQYLEADGRSRPVCSWCDRKGPGYDTRTERRFEIALYHQLGKLPEPIQTHRFC